MYVVWTYYLPDSCENIAIAIGSNRGKLAVVPYFAGTQALPIVAADEIDLRRIIMDSFKLSDG